MALAVATALLAQGGAARANGRYPAASFIAFDPGDPGHFVVSTTFGLVESKDGGNAFRWVCESALGATGIQDLVVAITASGATVTVKFDGVVTSPDGCSFHQALELDKKNMGDLSLRRTAPHSVLAFYADSRIEGGFESHLVESTDDGQTWRPLGIALPTDVYPLTIDVAPSDASRVYLSARLSDADDYASALLRSKDGGATFERLGIPETAQHHLAYIAAVHPFDPDRIYVRVYDPVGTTIWLSDDAGATFRKVFTGNDQIYGFALSPDGAEMALGGPGDGIWVGRADGTNLARQSDILPFCLGWSQRGLYACADQRLAPFSVGRSVDRGVTFDTLLRFDALCGDTGCAADTQSGRECPTNWEVVAQSLQTNCSTDAGRGAGPPGLETTGGACTFAPRERRVCKKNWLGGLLFLAMSGLWIRRRRDQVVTIA